MNRKKYCFTTAFLLIAGILTAKPVYENKFENLPKNIKTIPGIKGKAIVTSGYSDPKMLKALKPEQGSVTFWFKADGYTTDTTKQNIYLFMANGTPGWCHLFRYQDVGLKSGQSGRIVFYSGVPRNRNYGSAITPKAVSINDKRWQFAAITYDSKYCTLYLNGKLITKSKVPQPMQGKITYAKLGGSPKPVVATAFDEFKIFDKVLPEDKIYEIYDAERPRPMSKVNSITISGVKSAPAKIDGVLTPGEYGSTVGIMYDISNNARLAAEQSEVNLSYDNKFLYLGVKTPGDTLSANGQGAEDCWDDTIELYLVSPKKDRFQWIINFKEISYSCRNNQKGWQAKGLTYINKLKNKVWTMELKIPFSDLGVTTPADGEKWSINVCRSFSKPSLHFSALGPSRRSYAAGIFPMTFKKSLAPYRIVFTGDIYKGTFKSSTSSNIAMEFIDATGKSSTQIPAKADSGEINISAKNAYNANIQVFGLSQKGSFGFLYLFTDIKGKKLHVSNSQPAPLFNGKPAYGKLYLQDPAGNIVSFVNFSKKSIEYENVLSLANVKPGDYKLCIDIKDSNGKSLWEFREDYRVYPDRNPPWRGNKIGISNKVPHPYTPLKVNGNNVDVICRTYKFAPGSLLPAQIISRNQQVLASPITITGKINGVNYTLKGSAIKITPVNETICKLNASGKLGPLAVKMSGTLEFDGFLWLTAEFQPQGKKYTVSDLALNIPMSKNCSDLRNFNDYRLERTGTIPQGKSTKDLLTDSPVFWLGGNEAGLQFIMEKLENFHLKKPKESLVLTRKGDMTVARVNIFDTAVVLDKPRKIEFGFEATPIRNVNPKSRNIRMWTNLRMNFNQLFNLYNYPELSMLNKERKAELDSYQKNRPNTIVAPYMALNAASPCTMEYRYFGDTWRVTPAPKGWDRKLPSNRPDLMRLEIRYSLHYLICPDENYVDFYMKKMEEAYKKLKLRGWYVDWGDVRWCDNNLHGHGWTDWNGKRRPTWNFRRVRSFTRRIYTFMKSLDKDSIFMLHSSGTPSAPGHGFCDIFVDGENLATLVGNNMNYHFLNLDTYRAGCNNYTWGWTNLFIPQYTRIAGLYYPQHLAFYKSPAAKKVYNQLIGMILVNDSAMHNCFGPSMTPVHAQLDKHFGWDDKVKWTPYWRINKLAEFNAPGGASTAVSIFERNGKYLFIAYNNTDKTLDFSLNFKKGIKGWSDATSFFNVMTEKSITPQNGKLTFSVQNRDFIIMVAK